MRYDECHPGEEVIYVVSTIERKAASIKAGAEHSNRWSIIVVRGNAFASVELIETFLNRSYKLNSLSDLLERTVIGKARIVSRTISFSVITELCDLSRWVNTHRRCLENSAI